MKIAVCYNGVLGREANRRQNFINNNEFISFQYPECDVFCHSWTEDPEVKDIITNKLKPTETLFEAQIPFKVPESSTDKL